MKGQREQRGSEGSKGGGGEGVKGSEGSKVLGSPPPAATKSLISTYSAQVSPLPANRTTTPSTFTEWHKVIVGPHHQLKVLGQKQPINH